MTALAAVLGAVFLAGLLRGFTGFGFALAAVPLLSLARPPAVAVPVALMLQLVVTVGGLRPALALCDWRAIRLMLPGAVLLTPVSAYALTFLPAAPLRLVIAAVVGLTVLVLLRGGRGWPAPPPAAAVACGAVSGVFNGLAGMSGPPVIAYFLAVPNRGAAGRASMIVFFGFTSVIALVPLAAFGLLDRGSLLLALAGAPFVLAGTTIGGRMFHLASERTYRAVGLGTLALAAALAGLRALT